MKRFRDRWFDNPYLVAIIVTILLWLFIFAAFVASYLNWPPGSAE